ncbi:hypothetical protein Gohar_027923, partial [Gossypium harknessii]|nr:hypothetical protein [Gossypium harknessii]
TAKTLPKGLHCLPLRLTTEYYTLNSSQQNFLDEDKLEDPRLYHYALFSDNILAAAVVVNSTISHVKHPSKHVFHIVTDRLNYAAMRMWFLRNSPGKVTIQVQNIEEFTWLNSSYSPVLKQLGSPSIRDYYFRAHRSNSVSNLKYRNPKYLSILNHLRFYLPEIFPKLNKVLFLDDDVVVQKDLSDLWSLDLKGNVNGAVETCGESFHRFDRYLNFSHPLISKNFDPHACGWAYGMNIFDLAEWRRQNITEVYHRWQKLNHDRQLWKLGTLPPGLITFWKCIHPLNRSWHVLGLGYDPNVNQREIERAAVIHYNGNLKPWLEIGIPKYRNYWAKYVDYDTERLARLNFFLLSARQPTHHAKSFVTKPASSSYTWECNVRINEFGHRGSVEEAKKLFDEMPHSLKDAASYASMIDVYLKNDDLPKAETLFHSLPYRNIFAESAMIHGYVKARRLPEARRLFNDMVDRNAFSGTSLISGYFAIGQVGEGRLLFEQMPDSLKNVVSWTTFVLGYARNGLINEGRHTFDRIPDKNIVAWTAMLESYVDNDQIDDALRFFYQMPQKEPDKNIAKHYSCLVGIIGQAGQLDKAMSVVKKMPPSKRDGTFLGALLAACRAHGGHKIANHISKQLIELEPTDSGVYVLLANVYAAHEKWDEFAQVRKMMRERKLKKVASFSQVEVKGKNHVFFVGDRSDPQVEGIHEMLRLMHYHLLRPRWVTLDEIEHLNVSLLTQLLDLQGAEEKCSFFYVIQVLVHTAVKIRRL